MALDLLVVLPPVPRYVHPAPANATAPNVLRFSIAGAGKAYENQTPSERFLFLSDFS